MLSMKDPPQNKTSTQAESERMGKNVPYKQTGKNSRGSNTYIRQNRLQHKGYKKRQRSVHNS